MYRIIEATDETPTIIPISFFEKTPRRELTSFENYLILKRVMIPKMIQTSIISIK